VEDFRVKDEDEQIGPAPEGEPGDGEPASDKLDRFEDGLTSEIENRHPRQIEEKEVQVVGVYEHQEQGLGQGFSPPAFVLLRDKDGRQVLIFIGRPEAFAISLALEEKAVDRPLTHDLMKNIVDHLGGKIERILIDDIWQDTYYAKISMTANGKAIEIDSRPSDAIALALRTKAPIFMAEYVLEQASINEDQL
jgi:bifunctional DNase/RNase